MREKETSIGCLPICALTRDGPCNLGMCPDLESNQQPFSLQDDAPTNWATLSRACSYLFWYNVPDLASKSPLRQTPVSLWHVPIIHWALPFWHKNVPGHLVLVLVLKSVISLKRPGSSCWRMAFKNQDLGATFACCYWDDPASRTFCGQRQENR